ncbi:hypothetical protein MBRA1_000670 [Malassezia brasiliensis]|uniref:Uncharacterized protein n=1 Tax=Malassezia brasiliensis TaxID=1821822 RepID=A0AAF0DRE1_9BASI|nr:hypothetical protein MBRA1_000670 [Malassezia brasiliensis]
MGAVVQEHVAPWDSLRRVSYTLPSLISLEDDPRHRYMPDASGAKSFALPVLDFPVDHTSRTALSGGLHVRVREPRSTHPRPHLAGELRPRHIRPVAALAAAGAAGAPHARHEHQRATMLYSAGCDGLVYAWDLSESGPLFRQNIRAHDNWISSMVLCNDNQTVVTGSLDCTVKAWSPHMDDGASLHELGAHSDFVKDLALAASADWVVSAGLDTAVCLWDLRHGRKAPMWRVRNPAAIYSTGSSRSGGVIATGGVDCVVRGWDPRMRDPTFELVGHQDNVRTLAVSESGRYVLSGSSDTTLRLWDVGEQRCVHTFTHHNSSIWSLYSDDPDLTTFYSGDRDGYLCKVHYTHGGDPTVNECVVLARTISDAEDPTTRPLPIQSIVADGEHVWTSNARTPTIQCWRNLSSHTRRTHFASAPGTVHGVPLAHCVNLAPNETLDSLNKAGFHDLVHSALRSSTVTHFHISDEQKASSLSHLTAEQQLMVERELAYAQSVVTEDVTPLSAEPTYEIRGYHGALRAVMLNDRIHALSIDTGGAVALWNIVQATCVGTMDVDRVREAAQHHRIDPRPAHEISTSPWRPQDTPSDTLAMVQNLVESDAVVPPWCSLDTATGNLTVRLEHDKIWTAEVYVEDLFRAPFDQSKRLWNEERTYIGATVLRNLFAAVNGAEALLHPPNEPSMPYLLYWLETHQAMPEQLVHTPIAQVVPPSLVGPASAHETIASVIANMIGHATVAVQMPAAAKTAASDTPVPRLTRLLVKVLTNMRDAGSASNVELSTSPTKSPTDDSPSSSNTLFGLRKSSSSRKGAKQAASATEPSPMRQHLDTLTALLRAPRRDAPPLKNTPQITYPAGTLVSISRDLASSEQQRLAYRGRVSHIARDAALLELLAPPWLLSLLLNSQHQDPAFQRMPVVVEPWSDPKEPTRKLPALSTTDAQFSAARMVRAARVGLHVQDLLHKAGLGVPAAPSLPPDSCIEILCNGQLLSSHTTLAQCQRHYWKSTSTMKLQYRQK